MAAPIDPAAEIARINGTESYHGILGLEKPTDEAKAKKAYRKLALKLHPDKCSLEGAEGAFKKLSTAYACLSDEDEREHYERFGAERGAELIEGSTLGADLRFGFVFRTTPADRLRVCYEHPGTKFLQRIGSDGDDMVDAGGGGTRFVQLAVHVGRFHDQSGLGEQRHMSVDGGTIFQIGFDTGGAGCGHIRDDPSQFGLKISIFSKEESEPRVSIAGEGRHFSQGRGGGVQSSRRRGGRKADGANEVAAS